MARAPRFQTFARDLQMATASIAPQRINAELAKFARRSLAEVIASREASSVYTKYVATSSGVTEGAAEERVEAPGPILYVFSYWQPVVAYALAELERHSPRKTGAYITSQVVMIGGQIIEPTADIAADEEVMIVATVPYARKIEVGHMRMSMPDGVFQRVRRKVQSRYGLAFDIKFRMVPIPGGYTLKGRFTRGYKPFARSKLRADTQAGAIMMYPAIVMTVKQGGR